MTFAGVAVTGAPVTQPATDVDADGGFPGRRVGAYELVERVGVGGFGTVWRAEQPELARPVAVKLLRPTLAARAGLVERFHREARLAARLDHPGAAHVYASGQESDGTTWIAMEWVRGTPLSEHLRRHGAIPLPQAGPLVEQLADVLQAAHDAGIVHRDVKPSNVMVREQNGTLVVKLLDFGLARGLVDFADATVVDDDPDDPSRTRQGAAAGTPLYMPPEQWRDVRAAGPGADQYAFAALTYEALTGLPPFQGSSVELSVAHAQRPPPSLGVGFPSGLDAVLARALAKSPAGRFPSVRAFASAFSLASGLSVQGNFARLDPSLRDEMLGSAPQPIAETLALLDAATHPYQALDAAVRVARVTVRCIALAALAGAEAPHAPAAVQAARDLFDQRLSARAWAELAVALLSPYRAVRDAFPVPALVAAAAPVHGPPRFTPDLVARAAGEDEEPTSGGFDVHARLEGVLDALARLLRVWSSLRGWSLVVGHGGTVERWVGLRRPRREAVDLVLPDGAVALAGPGGAVLRLDPLVQVAAPTEGAARELFLLEGRGRQGANLVAWPVGFERRDDAVWDWIAARLRVQTDAAEEGAAGVAPYRGLPAFTVSDAAYFFGRERAVEALVNRLRVEPLLAVVGPSGAGKSSFVQAGVVPALPATTRVLLLRPGPSPMRALGEALGLAGLPDLSAATDETLVVVDQLEEVLTLCADPAEQQAFSRALADAATDADGPVRVILTLRDDFLARVERLPGFHGRLGRCLELLGPPDRDDLVRILTAPAAACGYRFEDPETPARMVDEVAGAGAALPLLSFAAARLWERRDRALRRLPTRALEEIGGVLGALARHAEDTLALCTPEEHRQVRTTFRRLVTRAGTRARVPRADLIAAMGGGERVLERLVGARLLVATQTDGGDTLEVAHEALIDTWPRLRTWRLEDAEGARVRERLDAAARDWEEHGRGEAWLSRGEALGELRRWRETRPEGLTGREAEFLRASDEVDLRSGRRRRASLVGVLAGLVLGVALLLVLNGRAERARADASSAAAVAQAQLLDSYLEQGRRLVVGGDPLRAMVYLSAAFSGGRDTDALRFLLGQGARTLEALGAELRGHTGAIPSTVLSLDGTRAASCSDDGTARVWEVATGREIARVTRPDVRIRQVDLSPDGRVLLTSTADHHLDGWDAATGAFLRTYATDAEAIWRVNDRGFGVLVRDSRSGVSVYDVATGARRYQVSLPGEANTRFAWSDDGSLLTGAGTSGVLALWSAETGAPLHHLGTDANVPRVVRVNPAGTRVAVPRGGGDLPVIDLASGRTLFSIPVEGAYDARFAPDGRTLFVRSLDGALFLVDAETGKERWRQPDRGGGLSVAAWTSDGAGILVIDSASLRVVDAATGVDLVAVPAFSPSTTAVSFDPVRLRAVVPDADDVVRIWDLSRLVPRRLVDAGPITDGALDPSLSRAALLERGDGNALGVFDLHSGARIGRFPRAYPRVADAFATFDPTARYLLSGGDGERGAVVWDTADPARVTRLVGAEAHVAGVSWRPDGARVATGGQDGRLRFWDPHTGALLDDVPGPGGYIIHVAYDPTGRRLAASTMDRVVGVYDATTGALQAKLQGHRNGVYFLRWSADGERLLSAGGDGTTRLWDVGTGALLATFSGHESFGAFPVFGPGGLVATSSGAHHARIWDPDSSLPLAVLPGTLDPLAFRGAEMLATDGRGVVALPLDPEARDPATVAAEVRCKVPFVLEGGALVGRPTECPTAPAAPTSGG